MHSQRFDFRKGCGSTFFIKSKNTIQMVDRSLDERRRDANESHTYLLARPHVRHAVVVFCVFFWGTGGLSPQTGLPQMDRQ